MAIEFLSEAMRRIASRSAVVEDLGSGYGGPHGPAEGPVWWQEGSYRLFSDIHGSKRMKWTPDGTITVDKAETNNANGQTHHCRRTSE